MALESEMTAPDLGEVVEGLPLPIVGGLVGERYRVVRALGAGGMGSVFEARQLTVNRRCAIKFLHAELAGHSRNVERFRREAHLLGALEHDHLTAVLDYGLYLERSPFLVMEYVEGQTLRDLLKAQKRLAPDVVLDIMTQAARGMAYVHRQGIVHRDLKPSNLMLTARSDGAPWLKILDFGVARERGSQLTPAGAELGTPSYMSPEQARGNEDVDARSDVYALGAIAYELLAGVRAHPGESYNSAIFHVLTQSPRPLRELVPSCPDLTLAVVERCLARVPERRYADATELEAALSKARLQCSTISSSSSVAGGEPLAARRVGRGSALWLVWLVAAGLLGALAAVTARWLPASTEALVETGLRAPPDPIPTGPSELERTDEPDIAAPSNEAEAGRVASDAPARSAPGPLRSSLQQPQGTLKAARIVRPEREPGPSLPADERTSSPHDTAESSRASAASPGGQPTQAFPFDTINPYDHQP